MEVKSLADVYKSVNEKAETIFVVPLIRFTHKKTDYLYLLYQEIIEAQSYEVQTISIFDHFKLVTGILKKKNAILHYHWLEFQDIKSLLGMPWKILCIRLFKLFGGNIVWTLHNEFPHDQNYLKLHFFLHRKMAKWADKLHVHCEIAIPIMQKRLDAPVEKFFVKTHPDFPALIRPKTQALEKLNSEFNLNLTPEIPIFLMFGNISRYKQLDQVARIVIDLPIECKLLIVGPIKKGNFKLYKELKALEQISDRIKIISKFIKEEQVPWFHNAADICLFNYREILSSGGVHLALSFKKPIIAPNKGCISYLADKTNVQLFNDQQEFRDLLLHSLKNK